jgi:hypothetical protein
VTYPIPEQAHWLFGAGSLLVGLCLVSELIVGHELWARRTWRAYLLPGLVFFLGLMLWLLSVRSASSTIHLIAHSIWASAVTLAGVAELGRERGKLTAKIWEFGFPFALLVSGLAFLVHENRGFWFSRAAFLHYIIGWVLIGGGLFYGLFVAQPRWRVLRPTVALSVVIVAVLLLCMRDVAPIFGHLSQNAGPPHR